MEVAAARVAITEATDIAEARRRAVERGAALHFDEAELGRLSIVVSEVASNVLKHGGGGDVLIGPVPGIGGDGVQVLALDRGPGIRDVDRSLRDGYSTAGTAGNGLGAIARVASTFDLFSEAGRGTVVAATVYRSGVTPLAIGAVSLPIVGERRCGDGWGAWNAGGLSSLLLSDGLGHGPSAADATERALEAFRRHAERSAAEVIGFVHDALRSTRGAAVAVAEVDHRQGTVQYCGIGNISASIITPDGNVQHLVSLSGIAGHNVRRIQTFTYPWRPGSVLVMHSDGINTHWTLSAYRGLAARRPDVVAAVLMRDHRRTRDDATVAILRYGMTA